MNPAQGIKPLTAKVIVAGGGRFKFFHVMVSDQLEPRIDPPMSLFEDDIIVRRSRSDHKTYYLDSVHLGLLRDYMSSDEGKEADYIEVLYKYIVQDVAIRNPLLKSRV